MTLQDINIPRHVGVIMDGNGRWAKKRFLPRLAGHKAGMEAVRRCVDACGRLHVGYLTLYAFSSENWRRPEEEVSGLMTLLRTYLKKEITTLHEKNVRMNFIGDHEPLSKDIRTLMDDAVAKTKDNTGLTLTIALNYGARAEIVSTIKKAAQACLDGKLKPEDLDDDFVQQNLHTHDMPDPDLIIRTSGEQRLSNFLMWQAAYSEFVFLDEYWPEFGEELLLKAFKEYTDRERRFGGV